MVYLGLLRGREVLVPECVSVPLDGGVIRLIVRCFRRKKDANRFVASVQSAC